MSLKKNNGTIRSITGAAIFQNLRFKTDQLASMTGGGGLTTHPSSPERSRMA